MESNRSFSKKPPRGYELHVDKSDRVNFERDAVLARLRTQTSAHQAQEVPQPQQKTEAKKENITMNGQATRDPLDATVQATNPTKHGLDSVNISFLDKSGGTLPLVVTPRFDASLTFLEVWCQANRTWLNNALVQYGAVLVRGFQVHTPADMERAIHAYQPCLNDTYRGTSPRTLMDGTAFVFSAAEVPTNYPIAQHLEMSFLDAPPKQLYFGCIKPSKSPVGGETALADFRKVYHDLPDDLKLKFLDKGVRYTRTHRKKGTYFTYDVADMVGWPELFGTSDKAVVERMCKDEGIPVTWTDDGAFCSVTQSDAFQLHPVTGVPVYFNHTQVFHWTTFPAELWFAFLRSYDVRLLLHCMLVTVFCVIKYGILGHRMSLHATFGDGEPISFFEMNQIRRCIHQNMVFSRWKQGDMLLLDNFGVSHGRQPTYDKGRKVVVAWADPVRKANSLNRTSSAPPASQYKKEEEEVTCVVFENPQERTPESTLTEHGASLLLEDLKGEINNRNTIPTASLLLNDALQGLGENPQDIMEVTDETLSILKNIVAQVEARKASVSNSPRKAAPSAAVVGGRSDFWQKED